MMMMMIIMEVTAGGRGGGGNPPRSEKIQKSPVWIFFLLLQLDLVNDIRTALIF